LTTTAAAVATVTCEAAPILASALADLPRPSLVTVAYSARQVTVTAPQHRAEATFDRMISAFTAAGWGFTTRFAEGSVRVAVSFQPPWELTQDSLPAGGVS